MQKIESLITPQQAQSSSPVTYKYTDLSRGASQFGIKAQVYLENRVLEDYEEIDPALGHNLAGVTLSILAFQMITGDTLGDSRMTICVARRDCERTIEVDLAVLRRLHQGKETYFVRFMGERESGSDPY